MMVFLILVLITCVSAITLYISVQVGFRTAFDRCMRMVLGCLILHALYAGVLYLHFSGAAGERYFMPACLLYGPLLYFAYRSSRGQPLRMGSVLLHTLPFWLFLVGYVFFWVVPLSLGTYTGPGRAELYGCCALSHAAYAAWALFFRPQDNDTDRPDVQRILSSLSMLVAFCAVTFSVATYATAFLGQEETRFVEFVAFLDMFGAALLLFSYTMERVFAVTKQPVALSRQPPLEVAATSVMVSEVVGMEEPAGGGPYQKSAVSADLLDTYEKMLRQLIEEEHAYLDETLSSASLAQQLKIPKHHLSQVFSQRIGKNFNTYVNEYRVSHAVTLMHTHPDRGIAEIFMASGFASKASFNRYFKKFQDCTPTGYRNGIEVRIRNVDNLHSTGSR